MNDFYLQQRINFPEINRKIRVDAYLVGMTVVLECDKSNDLLIFFKKNSITYEIDNLSSIKISLQFFVKLLRFTSELDVVCDTHLKVLQKIILNTPINESPVTVISENNGYVVSWVSTTTEKFIEYIDSTSVAILIVAGVVFNAPGDAWLSLEKDTTFPLRAGVASKDSSTFIKISPYSETLVHKLDIPGIFKVKNNLYGVSVFSLSSVLKCDGLIIDQSLREIPGFEIMSRLKKGPVDTETISTILKIHKGRVIDTSNLNEFDKFSTVLNIVDRNNLYPCLIVCDNESVPSWFVSSAEYLNEQPSLTDKYAKVRIVSYDYFEANKSIKTPFAVIFDNLDKQLNPEAQYDLTTRFSGAGETIKLALVNDFGSDIEVCKFVMPAVAPEEFPVGQDLNLRYVNRPDQSFLEHVNFYVTVLNPLPASSKMFSMRTVFLPKSIKDEIDTFKNKLLISEKLLDKVNNLTACGTGSTMSPKISECLKIVNEYAKEFDYVHIVSSSQAFLDVFRLLTNPIFSKINSKNFMYTLKDFYLVNVQPNSLVISTDFFGKEKIDSLLSSNAFVNIVHACETIDDKLAVMSVIKSDEDFVKKNYTDNELRWIFN